MVVYGGYGRVPHISYVTLDPEQVFARQSTVAFGRISILLVAVEVWT